MVDLFESEPGIINADIIGFRPAKQFDRLVSISTVEHIGIDDGDRMPVKALNALHHMFSMIQRGAGCALVTIPWGYNTQLDQAILDGEFDFAKQNTMLRGETGWVCIDGQAFQSSRRSIFRPGASAVWVASIGWDI